MRDLPPPEKPRRYVFGLFRMGEDDPGAKAGQPAAEKTINHGQSLPPEEVWLAHLHCRRRPGSSLAMNFPGAEGEYYYTPHFSWGPNEDFILDLWIPLRYL